MSRAAGLLGFFVAVLAVLFLLRQVPVIGRIFDVPWVGFWGAAILVALVTARIATRLREAAVLRRQKRDLGHVDTPRNQGKLGALLLASGSARAALGPLEQAVAGDPGSLEWRYRLGLARLECRLLEPGLEDLAWVSERDEEYGYGALQLRLARGLLCAQRPEEALAAIERLDRNHGPSPEGAFRRGAILRALGRREEARAALASVPDLARRAGGAQKKGARWWALRSSFARWT